MGVPTIVDRVIQQAITQELTPIYEEQFSENSFGFRPKRGAHDALRQCQRNVNDGYVYVVDMDLEKFFDTVCQSKLIEVLTRTIKDALHTFDIDAQVVDMVMVGSWCRGIEHEDSDVDVVVEYYGSEREDSLFNILNEEGLSIGGRKIDINPITKDKSGTLETYLLEVERYLAEKTESMEQPSRNMAGDIAKEQEKEEKCEKEEAVKERPEKHKTGKFANFSMQKSDDSEKYYLFADIKYPSGDIERHKPIAEFADKKEADTFVKAVELPVMM